MENSKRNKKVDMLRGIAVLAVLLGHAIQRGLEINYLENIFFKIIYSFHMPLFMVISGYSLFKYSKKLDFSFMKKRFIKLIIPTFIWSYLIYFMRDFWFVGIKPFVPFPDTILEYTKLLLKQLDYIIWFLYIVFLCNIIFYLKKKITKNNLKIDLLITLLITIIIFYIPITNFGFLRLRIYFPLFCFGYYLDYFINTIKKYQKYFIVSGIIIYLLLFKPFSVLIDNLAIYYLISLSAIMIIYTLVNSINSNKIEYVLSYFGSRSLEIYLCQCLCLNIGIGTGPLRVITIFITATIISCILAEITTNNKILSQVLYGKIPKKN